MTSLRVLLAATVLLGLSACDAGGSDDGATTGVWVGTAEFRVDTLMQEQNFRVIGDYETRYVFELNEDENGLILGQLSIYNTGTLTVREPRDEDGQTIIEHVETWDNELAQTWPVYGTYGRPVLEVDLPQAEADGVFAKDLWTFVVTGDRARLDNTRILHGYPFDVFEDGDASYTVTLSPSNEDEFRMERQ